jgi:cytosine/adenosine deaminase-related metal-dependent hydrolase
MGTVHHTERIAQVLERTGLSGVVGKAIMDRGEDVSQELLQKTDRAIAEAVALGEAWDGAGEGRIRVCLAPRFVLSVSRKAWRRLREIHEGRGWRIHTHASETPWENRTSRSLLGRTPIPYLAGQRILGPGTTLAHAVWLGRHDPRLLAETGTRVAHCPSSNMKLGSGLADVPALRRAGVAVGLGWDGAPCNNELDMFEEMRRALLVSALRAGPGQLSARDVLEMATSGGARCLGWEDEVGSLEAGRRADLVVLRGWGAPEEHQDPYATIVQAGHPGRVRRVYVAGRLLLEEGRFTTLDPGEVLERAQRERVRLLERLGWPPSVIPLRWESGPAGNRSIGERLT